MRKQAVALLLVLFCSVPTAVLANTSSGYSWPVKPPTYITSTFGEYRGDHVHNGIDFSTGAKAGRNIHAIESGTVVKAFYDESKYGKTLIVDHPDGRRSWYSHLRSFSEAIRSQLEGRTVTEEGTSLNHSVQRGEVIARSGHTGSGPSHLHFILQNSDGQFINPVGHFSPKLPFEPEPHLGKLRFLPLTGSSWINGRSTSVVTDETDDDPLEVWGFIGLDVEVFNEHHRSSSRTIPETLRIYRDGEMVFERSFNRLTNYQQDTGVTLIYDEVYSNLNPTQFMLHATSVNADKRWVGMNFNDPDKTGTLRVEVESALGDRTSRSFTYRTVPPPKSVAWFDTEGIPETARRQKEASATFRLVSLSDRQRAQQQYSPPEQSRPNNPELSLDHRWLNNRVQFEVTIENRWSGWPELTISQDDFDTSPRLIQVRPGTFRTWWTPDGSRDGWHDVGVHLNQNGETISKTSRIYLQSFTPGLPGSVVSLDGRYSLFTTGKGLQLPTVIHFKPVDRRPTNSELEYVDQPKKISPKILHSVRPLELTTDLSDGIDNPDRVGLFRWNPVSNSWEVLSYRTGLTDKTRAANLYTGQTFVLLRDSVAPSISGPHISSSGDYVRYSVKDEGSGIDPDQIKVESDGESIDFRWDSFYDSIYVPRKNSKSTSRTVTVTVSDRAGNTGRRQDSFDW